MTNIKDVEIEIDEMNLEDLILLGEDKLINISIKYPKDDDEEVIKMVQTKAKIKQLTMKELRNINLDNIDMNAVVNILKKALFKQDETPFTKDLIYAMPIGVSVAIVKEIMRISGMEHDIKGL